MEIVLESLIQTKLKGNISFKFQKKITYSTVNSVNYVLA